MSRSAAAVILGLTLITATSSAGQSKAGAGSGATNQTDSAPDCWIELEFVSNATVAEVAAFVGYVRGLSGVATTDLISRREHVDRFTRELQGEGVDGERFQTLHTRVMREAGPVLLVTPRDARTVNEILDRLEELPASVTSSAEMDACHT
ncbi:MAG: hypothetical protein M3P00_02345 [Gemmatimonadota bacterium]|nr:hypothetical protein [Gemmatimonadota bacterium]